MNFTKKLISMIAASVITASLPFAVSAGKLGRDNLYYDDNAYCTYLISDGRAIITSVSTNGTYFDVPETIEYEKNGEILQAPVTGIEDYAFGLCENLTAVYLPDSFTLDDTGNVAFLTSSAVMNFLDGELGSSATVNDIVRYVALKANYKNGNFTDEDLADVAVKLENKLGQIDVSKATTLEGKLMTLIMNVNNMGLNENLENSFNLWISSVTYDGFTLAAYETATDVALYAQGREFLGMQYKPLKVITDYVLGDANGDGKFSVRDAAYLASTIAKGIQLDITECPAADYNDDGKITVRDSASMARALSKKQ